MNATLISRFVKMNKVVNSWNGGNRRPGDVINLISYLKKEGTVQCSLASAQYDMWISQR
jgi:hypothetical protein